MESVLSSDIASSVWAFFLGDLTDKRLQGPDFLLLGLKIITKD